ncbi:polysaccharide biosynthesis/export family protein [Hymenobacter sp. BT664]|uniref:Polysaccharide biosynthesis/export family protein n=1 Tax=Hymenobacter montanus TaxID=2771359 RepID=A0A927BFC3_9BACT|nr:polysaccharide biosynthesis/export family protein [Hymenobacter montanus]MBD2769129.1 polysaccharide biosynthesis/export family protein [Hymenobacter montanus]
MNTISTIRHRSLQLCLLLVLSLLSSCTQNMFVTKKKLPPASALDVGPNYQYHLRKDDKISVSVWDHEELSVGSIYGHYSVNETEGKWTMVDAQGNINVPKMGNVHVEGLTVPEAEELFEKMLSKWILAPQLTLKVLNMETTVLGEVGLPGKQRLEKERNTLVEVLGKAGDMGVYADKRHVKLLRPAAGGTQAVEMDLTQLSAFDLNNIVVVPGDVVYVPAKSGKQFDRKAPSVLGIASIVSTVLVITRFFATK